jgi:hypothetical protein
LAYLSFQQAKVSGKTTLVGRTAVNAAHFEYLTGKYLRAKELLLEAIPALSEDKATELIAKKELVRNLIKLGETQRAVTEIHSTLEELSALKDYRKIEGKLMLLLARLNNDPRYAEALLEVEEYGKEIHLIAAKFLKQFYGNKGDSKKYIHYYHIAERLDPECFDILD